MTPCDHCLIRASCDLLSEMCRLRPGEVIRYKPELVKPMTRSQRYAHRHKGKVTQDRKAYWAENYRKNRDRKLRAANERYARLREATT